MLTATAYISRATKSLTIADTQALANGCSLFNQQNGVDSVLLYLPDAYDHGGFFQYLEGPPGAIVGLSHRIDVDPRHSGIVTIYQETINEPRFPEWPLKFVDHSIRPPLARALMDLFACDDKKAMGEILQRPLLPFLQTLHDAWGLENRF